MRFGDLEVPESIILPSLGSYVNIFKPDERRVTAQIPTSVPMPSGGLDLDYTPLLVVKRLLVDQRTYSHIQYSDYACHKPLFETLRVLRDHGYVDLHDFSQTLSPESDYIQENMNARALENAGALKPLLQEAIQGWRAAQPTLRMALGKEYTEHVSIPIGIVHYLSEEGRPITLEESNKIEKLVFNKRQRLTRDELQVLRSVATPYVSYVHENLVLRDRKKVPFIDWHHLEPFYRKSIVVPLPHDQKLVEQGIQNARLLYDQFDLNLVRPATVYELLDLLKDKRINQLRERFLKSAQNNEKIDREWFEKQKSKFVNAHKKAAGRRLTIFISKLVPDLLLNIHGLGAITEVVGNFIEKASVKEDEWLYVIMKDESKSTILDL